MKDLSFVLCGKLCSSFINGLHDAVNIKLGKPIYFVFFITPTSTIYSQINDLVSVQRIEIFSLLAGITTAVVILMVYLIKSNSS
jgi:hypothetical protein